ncbi:MAG: hypothetical protein WA676_11425, partial [Candidatus Sulfotelmatobacter sp.]
TVLPTAAILRGPQGAFVYLVKPDKTVEARTVTIALTQGTTTAVLSGLNPGDTVVTDGQDKLQTGSSVEPRSTGATNTVGGGSRAPASGTSASGTSASGIPAS